MLHRPRRSVVYRSGKEDDQADRKLYRDRALDCVAILNQKGWYEDRGAPVDCLDMVSHSLKSYKVLSEDKWYGESFDDVCGELLQPNGSKRAIKGWKAVGLDHDHRVVCVPPGTIPEDASASLIRYAILHTTLFKKHVGKKRAEKLNSYAAKAMEAKTPREFLQIAKDMVRDLGTVLGKVFNIKVAFKILVSGMILFVVGAHLIDVKKHKSWSFSKDHYNVKLPKWIVDLADIVGQKTRKGQETLLYGTGLEQTLSAMHAWMDRNLPGYNFTKTIGKHTVDAIGSAVTYLLENAKLNVKNKATALEDMAKKVRDQNDMPRVFTPINTTPTE